MTVVLVTAPPCLIQRWHHVHWTNWKMNIPLHINTLHVHKRHILMNIIVLYAIMFTIYYLHDHFQGGDISGTKTLFSTPCCCGNSWIPFQEAFPICAAVRHPGDAPGLRTETVWVEQWIVSDEHTNMLESSCIIFNMTETFMLFGPWGVTETHSRFK